MRIQKEVWTSPISKREEETIRNTTEA